MMLQAEGATLPNLPFIYRISKLLGQAEAQNRSTDDRRAVALANSRRKMKRWTLVEFLTLRLTEQAS